MATDTTPDHRQGNATATRGPARAYTILIGVAALVVLLQGLWAGLFIQEGQGYKDTWVQVHARGAELAILLSIVAFVVLAVKFRERRDLLIGTGALAVLLIGEAYLGGIIGQSPHTTAIHMPLGMALMGLVVWLPMRARGLAAR